MISIIRARRANGSACLWWSHHVRVLHVDRRAELASRRPAASRAELFMVMGAGWRAGRQHQGAHGIGRGGSDLSVPELGRQRMEINRATGADHLDSLPSRWSATLVRLFGLLQRPLLRTPGRGALL